MTLREINVASFPESSKKSKHWSHRSFIEQLPECMPDGKPWPKITIVTPSYNQGKYIEETIRSILLQGYPNLEYIIIDAGSTDETVEVIKKYESWITYWVSEPDNGQSHAINKGFKRATGDLIVWINSDDVLLPHSLRDVAMAYIPHINMMILGDVINFMDTTSQEILVKQKGIVLKNFIAIPEDDFSWHQPGTFVSKVCLKHGGELDESLHYSFDWDWMCKMLIHNPTVCYLSMPIARFRLHDASKTGGNMPSCWEETIQVVLRYKEYLTPEENRHILSFYSLQLAGLYFSSHPNTEKYWNRLQGIKMLFKAMWHHLPIIRERQFWKLFVRALLPKIFYRSK